ncbi:MAG: hypothetical protein M3Z33_04560 [Actinomycetota bacterium]|nr:hypothetical protein [Actinomycetota bacterium]
MTVRTPPAHIYTSSLTRRQRAWTRSRRKLTRALASIAVGLVVVSAIAAAVLGRMGG